MDIYFPNQPSGFESYRGHVWTRTDADRTGIPKFLTEPNMSFEKYVDFALDIPVYALIRDEDNIRKVNILGGFYSTEIMYHR